MEEETGKRQRQAKESFVSELLKLPIFQETDENADGQDETIDINEEPDTATLQKMLIRYSPRKTKCQI